MRWGWLFWFGRSARKKVDEDEKRDENKGGDGNWLGGGNAEDCDGCGYGDEYDDGEEE
jgi:hypothetical protein